MYSLCAQGKISYLFHPEDKAYEIIDVIKKL